MADETAPSVRTRGHTEAVFAYVYVPVLCLMPRFLFPKILIRLSKLCVQNKKCRNQHQRLLKNMGAHSVVLDLLQIPYEKVGPVLLSFFDSVLLKTYHQVIKVIRIFSPLNCLRGALSQTLSTLEFFLVFPMHKGKLLHNPASALQIINV